MENLNAIPVRSRHVMTRKDTNGMLLFEIPTDEMYFVSNDGYRLFNLCDGSRTLSEILEDLAPATAASGSHRFQTDILQYFGELEKRKLIQLWE